MPSTNQVVALRMFSRKNGATVEQVSNQLGIEEKAARGLVDRLRLKPEGKNLRNVEFGTHRFKLVSGRNRRS